jgi:hypothetical protein
VGAGETDLKIGDGVKMHGLTADGFNGNDAVLDSFDEETGRWKICLQTGPAKGARVCIKPANLTRVSGHPLKKQARCVMRKPAASTVASTASPADNPEGEEDAEEPEAHAEEKDDHTEGEVP